MRADISMYVHDCTVYLFRAAACRKRDIHDTERPISDPASPKSYTVVRGEAQRMFTTSVSSLPPFHGDQATPSFSIRCT